MRPGEKEQDVEKGSLQHSYKNKDNDMEQVATIRNGETLALSLRHVASLPWTLQ